MMRYLVPISDIHKLGFHLLKVALTVAILMYLWQKAGSDNLVAVLKSADSRYLLPVFSLLLADTALRAYNWRSLLRLKDVDVPLASLVYIQLVGAFWGTFMPSSVGVDVVRMFMLNRRHAVSAEEAGTSMVVLNLINLAALCTIALLSSVALLQVLDNTHLFMFVVLVCFACFSLLFFLLTLKLPPVTLFSRSRKGEIVTSKVRTFQAAFVAYAAYRGVLLRTWLLSLLNQGFAIVIAYVLALSLHLDIPVQVFAVFVPVVTLARIVPVSIAGLGAEQGIFVYLFSQVGVPAADALLISLLLSAAVIGLSLVGGGVYAVTNLEQMRKRVPRRSGRHKWEAQMTWTSTVADRNVPLEKELDAISSSKAP